jgi:hypothetical protein
MGQKRHTPEEIVAKLRQMDVLVAPGTPVADAIRTIGMTEVGREMNCWMGRSFTPCSGAGFPYLDAPVRITIRVCTRNNYFPAHADDRRNIVIGR